MSASKSPSPAERTSSSPTGPPIYVGPARRHSDARDVEGGFADIDGEASYRIVNYDRMPPFFISLVSDSDHWLFISSNGALSAGRKSPEHALFPYYTVDKIHYSQDQTGSKTLILATPRADNHDGESKQYLWEPFSNRYAGLYTLRRTLYKSLAGDTIRFEEVNEDLGLTFTLTWSTSERFGFVKRAALHNHGSEAVDARMLDGMQNLMPYGISRALQTERSVLGDAYKKNELLAETGLGLFTLSAQPVDRAEPSEALKTTTVWQAGLEADGYLLSTRQIDHFRAGHPLETEHAVRAEPGAYFVHTTLTLDAGDDKHWIQVAEIEQDAADVVEIQTLLDDPAALRDAVAKDVRLGTKRLRALVGSSDGMQCTADRMTTARHYTNVLFNIMRGGVFDDGYYVERDDVQHFIASFNGPVARANADLLESLPERVTVQTLLETAQAGGAQLERLCFEYLPLIFSRRHGDPSRPWNKFSIDLRDENGALRRGYEGNWRDIFQNWEALGYSFPDFAESMIAKFVNASTADGYNPYRITEQGIDWEVIEPDDPWSYIGYWGDHQIVYLLMLLELSHAHHPGRLTGLLSRQIYAYANVPYRIKPYADLLRNPHDTIDYDDDEEEVIEQRVAAVGADGKLLWNDDDDVLLVTLAEKLLVPVLAKLSNFIPDGGIWMNTQRPEWNDANNALVGYGISAVTLYQLRRYLAFLTPLFTQAPDNGVAISEEVADLIAALRDAFERFAGLSSDPLTDAERKRVVDALGEAGSAYRKTIYTHGLSGDMRTVTYANMLALIEQAQTFVDRTIDANRRDDDLYHSYNLLSVDGDEIEVKHLYPMLEGQVSVLGSGVLSPEASLDVLEALRASSLYRADQHSYTLYPDRTLPSFLEKNVIPSDAVAKSTLLQQLIAAGDRRLVVRDVKGDAHFNGAFRNKQDVEAALNALRRTRSYAAAVDADRELILGVFEQMFDHKSYTGRSGTFFGYEGLGSIYWHMVSKLILAAQKSFFESSDGGADPDTLRQLGDAYYDLRAGLGTHKTPEVYGAFPSDPYSHTPGHAGAKQPGMTGQVKEDILCRWGELGVRVIGGQIVFDPALLEASEFLTEATTFAYFDVDGQPQVIDLDAGTLAFTYCQTPFVYRQSDTPAVRIVRNDGTKGERAGATLGPEASAEIFRRTGAIVRVEVDLSPARA